MSECLGLIAARGGSKRVPRKNLVEVAGRPLILWTIDAALDSSMVDRVVVSTDDPEIAAVAVEAGAEVPFRRSNDLATDHATGESVVLDALARLRENGDDHARVAVLQPTSPLRTSTDIDAANACADSPGVDAVISVCPAECPPAWVNFLPEDRSMTDFFRDGVRELRSQDHRTAYRLTGALEIYNVERAVRQWSLAMDDAAVAYVMPRERSIDIDDEYDMVVAEALLRRRSEA